MPATFAEMKYFVRPGDHDGPFDSRLEHGWHGASTPDGVAWQPFAWNPANDTPQGRMAKLPTVMWRRLVVEDQDSSGEADGGPA